MSLGITGQFASLTSDDDKDARYSTDMDASGAVMSELYLQYNFDNTNVKIGRQYFVTPLVAGSGSRFIRQSFEAYSLVNTSLPNTKIVAAYLAKFADRTDRDGSPGEFGKTTIGDDGAWTIYVKNNSIDKLTLEAQYAQRSEKTQNSKDGADLFYVNGLYKFAGEMNPYISAQYLTTSYEDSAVKDGKAYGVKVGATLFGLNAYAAYTSVGDGTVEQGIGSGAVVLYTNGNAVDAWSSTLSDTDAFKVGVSYNFDKLALALAHTTFDRKNQSDVSESNISLTYKVNKNLTAQVQYALIDNQYIVEKDMETDLRTRLIYSF